ncbi:RNA-binding domain-containing protein [Desulfoluna spongiiphila]|uniref:Putative DNA-binding domain-containing protein n=1 Tax=Desulfoluna spongiiphila TaxID=419481 RepID=A0A1G5GC34_9BACT|nr:RNA-binding domain-containing protein [Desulfoluna spongiiphila]SCY48318.1 Putative DNA-binding domain-containing protein [Desulfoluna spongiiphila]
MIKTLLNPAGTRQRLLRDLIVVILLTTGAITAVTLIQGANIRNDIAQEHIRQNLRATSDAIFQFYEPVRNNALLIQKWGVAGIWQMDDIASITAKLIPMMENMPQAAAVKFGDTDGRSYLLTANENIWITRTVTPKRPGVTTWKQWVNGQLIDTRVEEKPYDVTQRFWYKKGLSLTSGNQADVTWLPPYMLDYIDLPGLSAIMAWTSEEKDPLTSVLALDVSVNDLFNRISETNVGPNGTAFLFDGDASVYHPVSSEKRTETHQFYLDHTEVEAPDVRQAMGAWHAKGKPTDAFTFTIEGRTYWAGVQPITADTREFWIGVVVPQSDFLQKVLERRWGILLIGLIILGAGFVMAGFLTWKYRHQLRDMPNQVIRDAHFEDDVRRLIARGEGSSLEFKSTMRMNLKTDKNDKNIEIAWLKTVVAFMNTAGGIIAIGVNDDGEIVGTAPDGFESEDKCRLHFRNLMNQHIGLEFTQYLHLSIGTIDGHTVLVIECERADRPVFLLNKKDESFYVRSGPSSLSLTMRQMLKYLGAGK